MITRCIEQPSQPIPEGIDMWIINDQNCSVLIRTQSGQLLLIVNEACSTGQTESSRVMVLNSSRRWYDWLVQDTRQRSTIGTFKLLTDLCVIIPANYLYVEICDLIQIYTLKGWQDLKNNLNQNGDLLNHLVLNFYFNWSFELQKV